MMHVIAEKPGVHRSSFGMGLGILRIGRRRVTARRSTGDRRGQETSSAGGCARARRIGHRVHCIVRHGLALQYNREREFTVNRPKAILSTVRSAFNKLIIRVTRTKNNSRIDIACGFASIEHDTHEQVQSSSLPIGYPCVLFLSERADWQSASDDGNRIMIIFTVQQIGCGLQNVALRGRQAFSLLNCFSSTHLHFTSASARNYLRGLDPFNR
jgi:hypothetical protein